MRQPPKVGQTLYSLNIGNAARNRPPTLTPVTVVSVGRKYFYTKHNVNLSFERKFHLLDWTQDNGGYSADLQLYSSEQEYADEVEAKAISKGISEDFHYGFNRKKISLNNLRLIKQIIDSSNPFMKMLDETGPEVLAYLKSLKEGEEVVETTHSATYGKKGKVYISKENDDICVKWDLGDGKWMGTSVTWGTRRISDVTQIKS